MYARRDCTFSLERMVRNIPFVAPRAEVSDAAYKTVAIIPRLAVFRTSFGPPGANTGMQRQQATHQKRMARVQT